MLHYQCGLLFVFYGGKCKWLSLKKLCHLLLDKNLKNIDLERKVGLSYYAVIQLSKDSDISTEILTRICDALDCGINDIMEFIPANK